MNAIKRHWYKAVVSILVLAIIGVISAQFVKARSILPVIERAPDFTLTSSATGQNIHFSDSTHKVRLVTFFYTTCPDECPLTSFKMSQVMAELQKKNNAAANVLFMSITFDPTHDTLQVLNDYGAKFHADPSNWMFLRGTNDQIQQVLDGFGLPPIEKNTDNGTYTHALKTYLIDGNGNVRKTYGLGEDMNVQEITADIQHLYNS
ncbi:MAG: hypothetical protein JWN30_1652 [Bacilli bacterium]|nr:hypothetical protein [Bacilli bacterium]